MEYRNDPGQSMWNDIARIKQDFGDMLRSASENGRLVPPGCVADRILPAIRGEFPVDIREQDNEMVILADLPGVSKEDISIRLICPKTLEIISERKEPAHQESRGFYVRERIAGPTRRIIDLPAEVTDDGANAVFSNGVLEIQLKIVGGCRKVAIPID